MYDFVLLIGRNRKLQGLAASMIKLWEKCEIAKIAVKRGVQNTNSEMMAEELKVSDSGVSFFYSAIVNFWHLKFGFTCCDIYLCVIVIIYFGACLKLINFSCE